MMDEFFRLTAAGIVFCAHLGATNFRTCQKEIYDQLMTSPCNNNSCPYHMGGNIVGSPEWEGIKAQFDQCVVWGEFDRLDGKVGYADFCWNGKPIS
jgi:hypothetical protein